MVANALSQILNIESFSFTKLRSDLLTSLRGKCEHDQVYNKVWNMVKRRDLSPLNAYDANSTQSSSPSNDELNRWKNFTIDDGYLLHKGRVCVPQDSNIRRQILYECHDSPSASHPGICKTYAHLQKKIISWEYIRMQKNMSCIAKSVK